MFDYDDPSYYEPSAMDELFMEFQEKCKELLRNDTNSYVNTIIAEKDYYEKENNKLAEENRELKKQCKTASDNLGQVSTISMFVNLLKTSLDKPDKIYTFLDLLYKKDYNEDVHDTPLWIGALTQYYSHKSEIINLLRLLNVKLPPGVENFRLPIDWTEEELDIFFGTMYNHSNCNGSTYEGNLRFWSPFAMDSVDTMCKHNYSEIPWQYVLRNPRLKQEKYLAQIGQHATGRSYHWVYFYKIDKYLELSEKEIGIIINNIDVGNFACKDSQTINEFLLRNIQYIANPVLLDKMYAKYHNSYDFKYNKTILKMPYSYIQKWVTDVEHDPVNFIYKHKDAFTPEQFKELTILALNA